jgi:hypothetical protein
MANIELKSKTDVEIIKSLDDEEPSQLTGEYLIDDSEYAKFQKLLKITDFKHEEILRQNKITIGDNELQPEKILNQNKKNNDEKNNRKVFLIEQLTEYTLKCHKLCNKVKKISKELSILDSSSAEHANLSVLYKSLINEFTITSQQQIAYLNLLNAEK